ncbi:MAG: hypothetical protein MUF06_22970 [Pirellulaceae bacterium]|nr:hypothetical protein [Pirellulaceae bacterium]
MSPNLKANCPIYLLSTTLPCWKCGREQTVIALAVHSGVTVEDGEELEFGDPADQSDSVMLTYIEMLPSEVLTAAVEINPRFERRSSKTADTAYYCNGCDCGAFAGDHYLFSDPGEGFFPTTAEEAARIHYQRLPFKGVMPFNASWSHGTGRLILGHGQREPADVVGGADQ